MADLTAIILTRNEVLNIEGAIRSVEGFARRVVVVDSGSEDDTRDLSRSLGAEVLEHPFVNYASQFNWALDNAKIDTKWVLRLDADERMTPEVIRESCAILDADDPDVTGILMNAVFYMMGRPLRHGMTKKRKIMVFRHGAGRLEDRYMDEHTVLLRGHAQEIRAKFQHYDFKSVDHFVRKLNWYATRETLDVRAGNEKVSAGTGDVKLSRTRRLKGGLYYRAPRFFRCWLLFLYAYVFRLGFLDGREGLIYNFLYCYMYRFLVDAKLYEEEKTGHRSEAPGALK